MSVITKVVMLVIAVAFLTLSVVSEDNYFWNFWIAYWGILTGVWVTVIIWGSFDE